MVIIAKDGSCNIAAQSTDNRNECRRLFADCGFDYSKIGKNDIHDLHEMISQAIKRFAKLDPGRDTISTMRMSKLVKVTLNKCGGIESAFLYVNSSYFTQREAISFNSDGFIGFAGWASDNNVLPFVWGFREWLDCLRVKSDGD